MVEPIIDTEPVHVPEGDIIPGIEDEKGDKNKELTFIAEKIKEDNFVPPSPLLPPLSVPGFLPQTPPIEDRPLIIDIETTGEDPTKSRLICIGLLDPLETSPLPATILMEDEKQILEQFLELYRVSGYNRLIGYNLKFDFRYLFVKCAFNRLAGKELFTSKLTDLMQIYSQVKEEFVFGQNKLLGLDALAQHLLGMKKPINFKQLLKAYLDGDLETVKNYNQNDVMMTYKLWVLSEFVLNVPIGSLNIETPEENKPQQPGQEAKFVKIRCPNDLSEHLVPADQEFFICPIDNLKISVKDNVVM